jgi:hypothetical protein
MRRKKKGRSPELCDAFHIAHYKRTASLEEGQISPVRNFPGRRGWES